MRICIVTVAGYVHGIGGMQAHTVDLARGLVGAGYEVDVITAAHPAGVEAEERYGASWFFAPARTTFQRIPGRNPAWIAESYNLFARLHQQRRYGLVHSESTSGLGLLRHGVHRELPVVAKFHGNWLGLVGAAASRARRAPHKTVRELKHAIWVTGQHFNPPDNAFAFRACEAMVASHQQLRPTQRSFFLRSDRTHVVPNAVDTTLFAPRRRSETRKRLRLGDGPVLVVAGRLNWEKGTRYAIQAVAELCSSFPDIQLAIVGDGEELDELRALTEALGVSERVRFPGAVAREEVAAYLGAADVFLFPTERDEAAPLVLPEAMACGCSVVASEIGGIPEVIGGPDEAGVLVPPGDLGALVAAIRDLLADPSVRAELGKRARKRIEETYSLERMIESTLHVYRAGAARLGHRI